MSLHHRSRAFLCRSGFLAACVLPTLCVLAWAWRVNSSGHVEACRSMLAAELGVPVRLESVSYPSPGIAVWRSLTLEDPESGQWLFAAKSIEVAVTAEGVSLIAQEPQLQAAAVPHLRRLLEERLQIARSRTAPSYWFRAAELKWRQDERSLAFFNVQAQLGASDEGPQVQLSFVPHSPSDEAGENLAVWCSLRRAAGDESDRLLAELNTGEQALPCWFLAALLQHANPLGDKARFQGVAVARARSSGWQGELSGTIEPLELHALLPAGSPHRLEGTGKLAVEVRFADDRLLDARGSLSSGPGVTGLSLVDSLCSSLGVRRALIVPVGDMAQFDQLSLGFSLDARGVKLQGSCAHVQQGVFAADRGQAVLVEPARQPQPLIGLIRALVPNGDSLVPANRAAARLLQVLPINGAPAPPHVGPTP